MVELNFVESRILGCLIEKQVTTPDYYPLTLNSLASACNQRSNRHPAVDYDDKTVVRGLDDLREHKLAWMVSSGSNRVPKYEHRMAEMFKLSEPEIAVICLLLLRGPQTTGELKSRSARLYPFVNLTEVENTLHRLTTQEGGGLVVQLPRQSGRKECRWMHLFSGTPEIVEEHIAPPPERARAQVQSENERYASLKAEVDALRVELKALTQDFSSFRSQFE